MKVIISEYDLHEGWTVKMSECSFEPHELFGDSINLVLVSNMVNHVDWGFVAPKFSGHTRIKFSDYLESLISENKSSMYGGFSLLSRTKYMLTITFDSTLPANPDNYSMSLVSPRS